MFWRRKKKSPSKAPEEPLFTAIKGDDAEIAAAHGVAASTLSMFRAHVLRQGDHMCCAKLRFRDPDLSAELGEDRFVYIWLNNVHFHEQEGLFSGTFFELPPEFTKWHHVGQRLAFDPEDIFDWMVNDDGHLYGGFTMRVARARLPADAQANYDSYAGVTNWEPIPR